MACGQSGSGSASSHSPKEPCLDKAVAEVCRAIGLRNKATLQAMAESEITLGTLGLLTVSEIATHIGLTLGKAGAFKEAAARAMAAGVGENSLVSFYSRTALRTSLGVSCLALERSAWHSRT